MNNIGPLGSVAGALLDGLKETSGTDSGAPHSALNDRPERLPLGKIERIPELFQPRGGIDERHVGDLVKAVKSFGELDPVMVIVAGARYILVDGHHRVEAYERAGIAEFPVVYFGGTPEEAVLASGQANSKAKLPMSNRERQDYAWRLVVLDRHSKAEIAKASGVSDRQVANMRKVAKALGEEADGFSSWFKACQALKARDDEAFSEEDIEIWKREKAERIADRLVRVFAMQLARDPEVTAMALATYFGRRLQDVVHELGEYLPKADDEADEF